MALSLAVSGGRAPIGAIVQTMGVPVHPASPPGMAKAMVTLEPSWFAVLIAQRRDTASPGHGGGVSAVVVTVTVVASLGVARPGSNPEAETASVTATMAAARSNLGGAAMASPPQLAYGRRCLED
jgi:hypothetical protein